jgi:hypothetical protein
MMADILPVFPQKNRVYIICDSAPMPKRQGLLTVEGYFSILQGLPLVIACSIFQSNCSPLPVLLV